MARLEATPRRRNVLTLGVLGSAALVGGLAACGRREAVAPKAKEDAGDEEGVSAVEDLMREHGVIRRILIVYAEAARGLKTRPKGMNIGALADAAALFRAFGEDYHERALEERYIFPQLRKAGGEVGDLVDTLVAQHNRGREITDYVRQAVRGGSIGASDLEPLSRALLALNRMYQAHAAWEDTIVFPAWKKSQTPAELDELAGAFEGLEHRQFGADGFNDAVKRVSAIEAGIGLTRLDQFTAPAF
jgi:hemerythrin-like domain-containing protein